MTHKDDMPANDGNFSVPAFMHSLGDSAYSDMVKRHGAEHMIEMMDDVHKTAAVYGDYVTKLTDRTDMFLVAAVLQGDIGTVVGMNANAFFSGMMMYRMMVRCLDPEIVSRVDSHDPMKFNAELGQWEDDRG